MLNFIDFEVFKEDWMVVIINPINKTKEVIINDSAKLNMYYSNHKNEIFIGYNIKNYDQYILKGILCGFNPKKINDFIIIKQQPGYKFSSLFRKIKLNIFEVMTVIMSLKTLEGFMGISMKETSVPFDLDRKLTDSEILETVKYCTHDVESTMEVFMERKQEFDSHMQLIQTFNLPLEYLSKTKAQLSATILNCQKVNFNDEWEIDFIDTLEIKKYKSIQEWFKKTKSYDEKLETNIAGIPHVAAWGGLHGAKEKYYGKGLIIHVDVNSFYPAIMIEYGLLSRSVSNPDKYKEIRDKRIQYKMEKNPLQAPYKIVLNSTYGICKDKFSAAYDPRRANEICVNGQLLLIDLIEHLEVIKGFELIQSNTDGLIVNIPNDNNSFEQLDDICYEWEKRTRMGLGFDFIQEIWQKDVNNYVFKFDNGKLERKGAYVKENNTLDNDLPILNTALVKYMINGVPIKQTIDNCNDLMQFQKIIKVSSKYSYGMHNGEIKKDKVFRVFASTDKNDGRILKVKENKNPEKFANTPDNCFIYNSAVSGESIPEKLDKDWYINFAEKRLSDFGL